MAYDFVVRPFQDGDLSFLSDMLYEAAAVAPQVRAMGKDAALRLPEIGIYIDGWGRPGDAAVIAVDDQGRRLGAAWYRCFAPDAPGYGYVAADVPEIAIGVISEARGQGVGGALIDSLTAEARAQGHHKLSLAVDRTNPAVRLYERHGFRDAGLLPASASSMTMTTLLECEL